MKRLIIFLGFIALLSLFLSASPSTVLAQQSGAASAISSARVQLVSCYNAAREAEATGANITKLASVLNEAGSLLSSAEFAFSHEDFDLAHDYAVQCQDKLTNFVSKANAISVAGEANRNQDFLINVIGSTAGSIVVLIGGLALWSFLKKKNLEGGQEIESAKT